MPTIKIINGNCLDVLKTYPDNYFDSVVTDPPYGISFMGKKWDYDLPGVEIWSEIFRVLKPGGHILVACGTRTQHRMAVNIEDAGFEIRDVITWHYGSGFPKSLNIGKAIDKLEIDACPEREGWGTALKPATEFFTLARKPLSEITVAQNVLKHGTGGLNIDDCRIELNGEITGGSGKPSQNSIYSQVKNSSGNGGNITPAIGRFPANVIFSHSASCICTGQKKQTKSFTASSEQETKSPTSEFEIVDVWQCVDNCPIKILDEQSGNTTSGKAEIGTGQGTENQEIFGKGKGGTITSCYADTGGASRFFYCAKASTAERNKGLEGLGFEKEFGHSRFDKCATCGGYILQGDNRPSQCTCENPIRENLKVNGNYHPTIKPVSGMQYLVRMITPKGGKCLEPFAGSGSTGIACKLEDVDAVLIEREADYCQIAYHRILAWEPDRTDYNPQLNLFME